MSKNRIWTFIIIRHYTFSFLKFYLNYLFCTLLKTSSTYMWFKLGQTKPYTYLEKTFYISIRPRLVTVLINNGQRTYRYHITHHMQRYSPNGCSWKLICGNCSTSNKYFQRDSLLTCVQLFDYKEYASIFFVSLERKRRIVIERNCA